MSVMKLCVRKEFKEEIKKNQEQQETTKKETMQEKSKAQAKLIKCKKLKNYADLISISVNVHHAG